MSTKIQALNQAKPVTSLTKLAEGVYQVTILRPNISPQLVREFHEHLDALEALKPQQMSLITTSAHPKVFCAGMNFKYFDTATREDFNTFNHNFSRLLARIVVLGFPTIAAINGFCIGSGLMLAMAHDFRYLVDTPGAILCMPEVEHGISLPYSCMSLFKKKLVGNVVQKLILECQRFGRDEALAVDLVQKVVPQGQLIGACLGLMEQLLPKSVHSEILSSIKQVLYEDIVDDCKLRFHMDDKLLDYFLNVRKHASKLSHG